MTSIETGGSREHRRVDPHHSELAKAVARAETRSEWVPAALDLLDYQLRRRTVLRGDGQFQLTRWAATEERFYLQLLTHTEEKKIRQSDEERPGKSRPTKSKEVRPSIELGAGPVWLFLAMMSWRRSEVEKNERNIVSVAIERRDDGTGKKGGGPLALRSGLNPKTIRSYLTWLQVGAPESSSLRIVRITPNYGPGGVSGYDWDGGLTSVILRMAKPNLPAGTKKEYPLQLSARIVVAALVLQKMKRGMGRVSLTRRDLTATGLNLKVAIRELNWLLKNGFFVRVGSGLAALPEMVEAGAYKAAPSGRFWDHNDVKKASKSAKTTALRDPPENVGMELRDPPEDPVSALRPPPVSALRAPPILQEGILLEERDSVSSVPTSSLNPESKGLASSPVSPLSPPEGSPTASPPSGEGVVESPEVEAGQIMTTAGVPVVGVASTMAPDTEHLAFETAVVDAVGDAAPQSWRKDNAARRSSCRHLLAFLRREGLDPNWAIRVIRRDADALAADARRFMDWTAVSAVVHSAVKLAAKSSRQEALREHHGL